MARDRDVRNAIQAALTETGAFDAVWIWGLPEDYGTGASNLAAPRSSRRRATRPIAGTTRPTGGLLVTSLVTITLLYRHEDPQLRDEAAELLFDTAAERLTASAWPGSRCRSSRDSCRGAGRSQHAPERRITASFSYHYIVEGWDSYDASIVSVVSVSQ